MLKSALAALAVIFAATPVLAQRFDADVDCAATGTELVYDCLIRLSQGGAPIDGAAFEVKAEMPEMPMAHNLEPVPAETAEEPGSYRVPLQLEMHGRWTLRLEFTAPRRDLVIVDREFLPDDGTGTAGDHKHHGN